MLDVAPLDAGMLLVHLSSLIVDPDPARIQRLQLQVAAGMADWSPGRWTRRRGSLRCWRKRSRNDLTH